MLFKRDDLSNKRKPTLLLVVAIELQLVCASFRISREFAFHGGAQKIGSIPLWEPAVCDGPSKVFCLFCFACCCVGVFETWRDK